MPAQSEPSPCVHGHPRKQTASGRIYCPACNKKYVDDNKEHVEQYKRKWEQDNRDKVRENWHRNKHKYKEKRKEWEKENKEHIKEKQRQYKENLHPLFLVWLSMNYRCHVPKNRNYKSYGGRGIYVHEPWRLVMGDRNASVIEENAKRFDLFKDYIDSNLGPKPSSAHSLDRINNNAGYEPDNLRWATKKEQANNKRNSPLNIVGVSDDALLSLDGETMTIHQLSERTGIPLRVLKYRFNVYGDIFLALNRRTLITRRYVYKGNRYAMNELVMISGLPRTVVRNRIQQCGWSVESAVDTPVRQGEGL